MSKEMKVSDNVVGVEDLKLSLWRPCVAEFLGTMILVLIGCGSIIAMDNNAPNHIQIAFTFGLLVATMAQCVGHVSGCHINPAVTISLFVSGDIRLIKSVLYIIAQCAGAALGSLLLMVATPETFRGTLGTTGLSISISSGQGFLMEAVYTFLLTLVVQAVCDPQRKDIRGLGPLAIGLSITACHLSGIKYTGSSMNPARSFGPALVANYWSDHWVYWAGPIIGGVFSGIIYKFIFKVRNQEGDSYDF